MAPLHAEIPYSLGQIILDFLSLLSYLLGWGRVRLIEKRCFFETTIWFHWFYSIFRQKKFLPPKQNHYLLSCSLHMFTQSRVPPNQPRSPLPTADQASLVTTWIVSLLKALAMAVGCVNQANATPREKTWCSSPINSTVCVGRLLCYYVGYCYVGCDQYSSRLMQREWPPWCSKLCRWDFVFPVKMEWPVGDFVLRCFAEFLYCHCKGNSCWLFDLWSKLNQEPRSCGK